MQPGAVVVDRGRHDRLVGAGAMQECRQALGDARLRPDEGAGEHPRGVRLFRRRPIALDVVDRRAQLAARSADDVGEALLRRGEQPARLVRPYRPRSRCSRPSHMARPVAPRARSAHGRRRAPASSARAQNARRRQRAGPASRRVARRTGSSRESTAEPRRRSPAPPARAGPAAVAEQGLQLQHVLREHIGRLGRAAQRAQGQLVRPRRAAEAEVDPAGIERLQRAELLGDDQRANGWAA